MMPNLNSLAARLIGGAIALALLIGTITFLVLDRNHWKSKAQSYNAEAATDYQAAITASGNPRLARKDTAAQILLLGTSLKTTTDALNSQNAAVRKLAVTSKAEQAEAAKAVQNAQERTSEAEDAAARLKAQSRPAPGKSNRTGTCEPDAAAKENWQ